MTKRVCYLLMAPFILVVVGFLVMLCFYNPWSIVGLVIFALFIMFWIGLGCIVLGTTPWGTDIKK